MSEALVSIPPISDSKVLNQAPMEGFPEARLLDTFTQ